MKTILTFAFSILFWLNNIAAPFQNLGFDDANTNNLSLVGIVPDPIHGYLTLGYGTPQEILPHWTLLDGPMAFNGLYNVNLGLVFGGSYASIYAPSNLFRIHPPTRLPVVGQYSFAMFPYFDVVNSQLIFRPMSLFQVGDVPTDAQTLRFLSFGREVAVYANDTELPILYFYGPPTPNPNARLANVIADISGFAGQTVELRFVTLDPRTGMGGILNGLDSIFFSYSRGGNWRTRWRRVARARGRAVDAAEACTQMRSPILALLCLGVAGLLTRAAPFQNLGFDAANTNNLDTTGFPPGLGLGSGTTSDLLPGWQVFSGTDQITQNVWVNLNPIGLGLRSLYNRSNSPTPGPFPERYPVQGLYSFGMFPLAAIGQPYVPYTLSQVGEVPADAQWLSFRNYSGSFRTGLRKSRAVMLARG
jgi:hypothetical protein